ncbi:MAG TPA: thrombospondin type 3 repeat-containing protein [Solirubrobacteraceae bacterium]|nr:thrombospondin type 3 repeat-containing protein [Solirubrobacteraceae bacterium]
MTALARLIAVVALVVGVAGRGPAAPAAGPLAPSLPLAAAHPEPGDMDGDEIPDESDNCIDIRNGDQVNTDGDQYGDACDADDDADGVPDTSDNCRVAPNPDQADGNGNGIGDACDKDTDADGVSDTSDNCLRTGNADQANLDGDALGDACDSDADGDGFPDASDNCPRLPNEDQTDADGDGAGSACDDDEQAPGGGGGTGGGSVVVPEDRQAPALLLRLPRRTFRHAELRSGLPVAASCSEACRLAATLTVRSGLLAGVQVGRGAADLGGAGATWVFVRLTGRTAAALRRQRRARLRLQVTAADAAGNRVVLQRAVVFRR